MSLGSPMLSEDDRPLGSAGGHERHVGSNGLANGHDEDVFMTEDDDLPLSQTVRSAPRTRLLKRKKPIYDESSSDDDTPLASSSPVKQPKSVAVSMPGAIQATTLPSSSVGSTKRDSNGISKAEVSEERSSGEDTLKARRPTNGKSHKSAAPPKKKAKGGDNAESEDDDDKPLVTTKVPRATGKRKVKAESPEEESEDEKPAKKTAKQASAKKAKKEELASGSDAQPKKKQGQTKKEKAAVNGSPKKKAKEEEEEEEVFRWWEEQDPDGDGSIKWNTLEHNGVIFPPPYEPLPSTVKMKYNGQDVDLPPAAEEVAGFYAAMIETEHAKDATFNQNFFEDWKTVMKDHPPRDGTKITSFDLCNFRPMFEYFEGEKAKKKSLTGAEKKEIKRVRDETEAKFTTCLLDGRKEKVGNFRVEPPGLFRGRGDHPKKGALKFRVRPEDITLNIGDGVPAPVPNMPGKWKKVIHDQTVTWLANWTENINGNHKYVFLAAGSSLKGQSDMTKFQKARELKKHVDRIRKDYEDDLRNKMMADRQRATAMYFIDKLALRAGNEKGEDEADTVGCCSLRCEHVTLEAPNFIIFDFLGKDSIRYYNRVEVDPQVFKNIFIFKKNKNDDDSLFDRVNTGPLNKHLNSYMKGLTAKVFRTYNASITFQQQLDEGTPKNATVQEKLNAYNQANRMVAILCNHQRSVPKTHDQSMEKMRNRVRGLKYDRMKLRHVLFNVDPKYKKKKNLAAEESDIDEEWIASHEEELKTKEIEKVEKKFAKENEKLEEEGKKPLNDSVLRERIEEVEAEYKRLEEERGTKKATLKRGRPTDKIEENIEKLEEKIKAFKLQIEDRDAGKEVALGTSKINYLDPRITAAWCKIHDVPIEKIFTKTLLVKFPWAMEVEPDWKF